MGYYGENQNQTLENIALSLALVSLGLAVLFLNNRYEIKINQIQ
ncbi:MAG: hypothetical protein ABRQ26_12860 [Syntrophomonadaceae bacterium]